MDIGDVVRCTEPLTDLPHVALDREWLIEGRRNHGPDSDHGKPNLWPGYSEYYLRLLRKDGTYDPTNPTARATSAPRLYGGPPLNSITKVRRMYMVFKSEFVSKQSD